MTDSRARRARATAQCLADERDWRRHDLRERSTTAHRDGREPASVSPMQPESFVS